MLDTRCLDSLDAEILVGPAGVVTGCEDEAAVCFAVVSIPDDRRDSRRAHETACSNDAVQCDDVACRSQVHR